MNSSNGNGGILIPNYTDIISSRLQQIEDHKEVVDFKGNFVTRTLFYLYLLKKYSNNNICYILNREKLTHHRSHNGEFVWGLQLTLGENDEKTQKFEEEYRDTCEILAARFVNCLRRRCEFILIPVNIDFKEDGKPESAHANVMIYKFGLNKIEHIEPHGQFFDLENGLYHKRIQFLIKIFIEEINKVIRGEGNMEEVEFVDTEATCPTGFFQGVGFQGLEGNSKLPKIPILEPGGYCLAWSMFTFEIGVLNPTMSNREISNRILNYISSQPPADSRSVNIVCDYLRRLIRGYANIVFQKVIKYFSSAFKLPINKHTVLSNDREIKKKIMDMMELELRIEDNVGDFDVQSARLDAMDQIDEYTAYLKDEPDNKYYKNMLEASTKTRLLLDNHLKLKSDIKNSPNVRRSLMKVNPPFLIEETDSTHSRNLSNSSSRSSSSSKRSLSPIVWHGNTENAKMNEALEALAMLQKTNDFQEGLAMLQGLTEEAIKKKQDVVDVTSPIIIDLTSSSSSSRSSNGSKKRSSRESKKPSHKNVIDLSSSSSSRRSSKKHKRRSSPHRNVIDLTSSRSRSGGGRSRRRKR
jgi:hypothetical protein